MVQPNKARATALREAYDETPDGNPWFEAYRASEEVEPPDELEERTWGELVPMGPDLSGRLAELRVFDAARFIAAASSHIVDRVGEGLGAGSGACLSTPFHIELATGAVDKDLPQREPAEAPTAFAEGTGYFEPVTLAEPTNEAANNGAETASMEPPTQRPNPEV